MLKIKTVVKESSIKGAGNGLFADQDISKGDIIWEYNDKVDKVINVKEFNTLSELEKAYILKYAYREGTSYILCSDDAKYMNHSSTPNCLDKTINNTTIALCDIKQGEELLCDYTTFDDDSKYGLEY
jgi:SET domain-containing protein